MFAAIHMGISADPMVSCDMSIDQLPANALVAGAYMCIAMVIIGLQVIKAANPAPLSKRKWRKLGFTNLEDFLVDFWEGLFVPKDPNNLLAMIWTWQNGNVGLTPGFNGDHEKALASIKAKTLVLPAERDLYFPVADEEYEVKHIPNAQLKVIPGVWGHFAGGGVNPEDTEFIDNAVKEFLASAVDAADNNKDKGSFSNLSISA